MTSSPLAECSGTTQIVGAGGALVESVLAVLARWCYLAPGYVHLLSLRSEDGKMAALPLNAGVMSLPVEQFSPGRIGVQIAAVLPSSWLHVGHLWTLS